MNSDMHILLNIFIGIAIVAFIIARQFRTRTVSAKTLIIFPLILLYLAFESWHNAVPKNSTETLFFILEIFVSVIFGVLRASTYKIWLDHTKHLMKGTRATLMLWVLTIGIRFGIDAFGQKMGISQQLLLNQLTIFLASTIISQNAIIGMRSIWKLKPKEQN